MRSPIQDKKNTTDHCLIRPCNWYLIVSSCNVVKVNGVAQNLLLFLVQTKLWKKKIDQKWWGHADARVN